MPTNTCIPYFDEADNITGTATAAITGKRFVDISGNVQPDNTFSVAPCAAGALPLGVAEYDAAVGQWLGIVREGIVPVTAGAGGLAAGAQVQSDATGQAVTWDGTLASRVIGKVLSGAVAGADAMICLYT